jgi:hypothetical protein
MSACVVLCTCFDELAALVALQSVCPRAAWPHPRDGNMRRACPTNEVLSGPVDNFLRWRTRLSIGRSSHVTWFTDERRQSWRFRHAPSAKPKDAMLSNISPERLDALLVAVAAVTTAIVAFAMIWIALFMS